MVTVLLEGLIVSCRRMLSVEDRAAIMVGLEAGLPQVRIARSIGHSPSVVCREVARHQRLTPGTGVKVFFIHPHSQRIECIIILVNNRGIFFSN